jgi:hypothetical protein
VVVAEQAAVIGISASLRRDGNNILLIVIALMKRTFFWSEPYGDR